jgi:mono/diheme cytochrome c family protein
MKKTMVVLAMFALVVSIAMPAFAADGAATFKAKCAMCHGADGTKENPGMGVKSLAGADIQKQSDADLVAAVTKGKGKMPAYAGKLSDDEIKGVVAFVRTLKK